MRELLEVAVLASQATLERGDPTEVALVAAAVRAGVDPDGLRRRTVAGPVPVRLVSQADDARSRRTGGPLAFVKGAPREILALCGAVRAGTETRVLTDADRGAVLAEHDRLAADGLRLLGVAVRPVPDTLLTATAAAVERDLTFLGFVALWDPPRPEIEDAVAVCRAAGIRVVMLTGDYGLTAQAIAHRIGLPVTKVVSGEEVERLSPAALAGSPASRECCSPARRRRTSWRSSWRFAPAARWWPSPATASTTRRR